MRALLQRVSSAKVTVDTKTTGEINQGILVFLGVSSKDSEKDAVHLVEKIINLRIFDDDAGKMNLSLVNINGDLLVVSQFTLYADTRKGRRPSFIDAARPEEAKKLYEFFVKEARRNILKVETGEFQAMMDVELVNDGPVTILIDSDNF